MIACSIALVTWSAGLSYVAHKKRPTVEQREAQLDDGEDEAHDVEEKHV